MAAWAKVGDESVVLSGETVHCVVFAEILFLENSCVSRTGRWETIVGAHVVNHRVGSGGGGTSVYHVCVKTM